jgi:hypothetical protein
VRDSAPAEASRYIKVDRKAGLELFVSAMNGAGEI